MSPPPPEPNLLDHVKDDTIWKWIGAAFAFLSTALYGMLRMLYNRDQKKVSTLFEWKDKTVDPAFREIPKVYATKKECDDCRETIHRYVTEPNEKAHDEMKKHLEGIDGKLDVLLQRR